MEGDEGEEEGEYGNLRNEKKSKKMELVLGNPLSCDFSWRDSINPPDTEDTWPASSRSSGCRG